MAITTSSVDPPGLFERLRQLRKELAEEEAWRPFVIFHDKTLRTIAGRQTCDAGAPCWRSPASARLRWTVWPARAQDRQRGVPVTFPCVVSSAFHSAFFIKPSALPYGIVPAIPHMSSSSRKLREFFWQMSRGRKKNPAWASQHGGGIVVGIPAAMTRKFRFFSAATARFFWLELAGVCS